MPQSDYLVIKKKRAVFYYGCYAVLSFGLASITTGGWTGFLLVIPIYAFCFTMILFALLAVLARGREEMHLSKKNLYGLFAAQLLAILLNPADGGDGYGMFVFIERAMSFHQPVLPIGAGFVAMGMYLLILAVIAASPNGPLPLGEKQRRNSTAWKV